MIVAAAKLALRHRRGSLRLCGLMSRPRKLLAVLLAVTWCSAAWHVDLEAVGLMLTHQHPGHENTAHHEPVCLYDHHEDVFARDVAKDRVSVGAGANATLWFALAALTLGATAIRLRLVAVDPPRVRSECGPPLGRMWQFVQRCAPRALAPPALV